MDSFQKFWSKPFNRGVIYSIGFLLVFGSFVIGAPESKRAEQKPLKSEITHTLPSKAEIELTPEEVIQPTTVSEAATVTSPAKPPIVIPSTTNYNNEMSTFNPFMDREISQKEQAAMVKELSKGPVDYPYEISEEALELAEESEKGPISKKKMDRRVELALEMKRKQPESDSENSKSTSTSKTNHNYGSSSYLFKSNDSSNEDEKTDPSYTQGEAKDQARVRYNNPGYFSLPANLAYTHEFLEIYSIKPGINAGLIPGHWGKQATTPLYKWVQQLKKDGMKQYHQLHDKYRIPPDWDNQYKFSDDKQEEIRLSQEASNRHLLSLGTNGEIIFIVRDGEIVNGPGADFVIWGHPFCFIKTNKTADEIQQGKREDYPVYKPYNRKAIGGLEEGVVCQVEPARVWVSDKDPAENDFTHLEPCQKGGDARQSKCAGYGLNLWSQVPNLFDQASGGDRYDLNDVGLANIRAIKIQDLGNPGELEKAGFDLDAIAIVHNSFSNKTKGSNSK